MPSNLSVFLKYFIPMMILMAVMLNRTIILKMLIRMIQASFKPIQRGVFKTNKLILQTIENINKQEFVFFTKGENIATLNKVMLYVTKNEHTKKVKIVTLLKKDEELAPDIEKEISFLDREYPDIDIEFIVRKGNFNPDLIRKLSKEWDIPINFMFIGSPTGNFPYRIEELGGVRLII